MIRYKTTIITMLLSFLASFINAQQNSHSHSDPRGTIIMDWELPKINKIITAKWGFSFGIESYPRKGLPKKTIVNNKICQTGSYFSFDVDDRFIYDVDQDITLTFLLRDKGSESFTIVYDRNIESMAQVTAISKPIENGWYKAKVVLKRARFANRGHAGTDFTVFATGANPFDLKMDETHTITISDVKIERSKTLKTEKETNKLTITTINESGKKVPVRLGIYALDNDWMPLPSNKAIELEYISDKTKQLFLRSLGKRIDYWPSENRHFIYSDGCYTSKLPIGKYKIIISKGPEYRLIEKEIEITSKKKTNLKIDLQRWVNMPKNNWYSGDAHIHFYRTKKENKPLQKIMQAEDIHLSNILQMGNPGATHFHQYAFGKKGQYQNGNHALVSGIEDPRTVHHGHTMALNVTKNLHNRDEYFLYHKILKAYQEQGGFTGYAHVDRVWFNDEGGLALNVPMGVIDFLEVLQLGEMQTKLWYDYLNLGFKLLPIAGSDFPYLDHPGSVRSYVKVEGKFTPETWFKGFKAGKTFVTNGPMLSFTVNDMQIGSTLKVEKEEEVIIKAEVKNDVEIDALDYLELVVNGKVIKKVEATEKGIIKLNYLLKIEKGSWFAVRAYGKKRALAHSAATYVHVDETGHLQKSLVKDIVPQQLKYLASLQNNNLLEILEIEHHEAAPGINELWLKHKDDLDNKIEEAITYYNNLLKKSKPN